jgi:catechol 2,3-dioxygenase-like lactoylglutathione lyase family enzyme
MIDHVSITIGDLARAAPFYAAFLLDPDGNRIEACCHRRP